MKLEYFDLISSDPLPIQNVGSIKPPTLRDIRMVTRKVYETYLAFLNMTPSRYCTEIAPANKTWYESLDSEQLCALTMYDIALCSKDMIQMYSSILDFFFIEHVSYSKEQDAFLVSSQGNTPGGEALPTQPGIICKSNFTEISNLILQLNHIKSDTHVDLAKIKSSKGRERFLRMQKAKAGIPKRTSENEDIELGNIISVVCTRHKSINYNNVWDLTIYQLWDIFGRLQAENSYELNKTSIAVWGNKENRFDLNSWFHKLSR